MNFSSTLLLINSVVSQPKAVIVPAKLKAMGRRAIFLCVFLTMFMAIRLQLMKNAPAFPA